MMQVSLMIFLAGMSYCAGPRSSYVPQRTRVNPAQRRLQTRVQLRRQIEQWRIEAKQIKPQEIEQNLKEKPDLLELEIMVGPDWEEVIKLLMMEMRRRAGRWEKAYVGRRLVGLLNLGPRDRPDRQNELLVSAFVAAPDKIRVLPAPSVRFPDREQENSNSAGAGEPKRSAPTEAYLLALRQAKEDAKNRNAEDERIMMVNRAVAALDGDFTALLLKGGNRQGYHEVIKELTRQLREGDSSFVQTVKALEEAGLNRVDVRLAKETLNKLKRLAKGFTRPRQYAVYTEVKKQQQKRSEFGQIELDFRESIQKMLSMLTRRIEEGDWDERSRALQNSRSSGKNSASNTLVQRR